MTIANVNVSARFQRVTTEQVIEMLNVAPTVNVSLDVEFKGGDYNTVSFNLGGHDVDAYLDAFSKLRAIADPAED